MGQSSTLPFDAVVVASFGGPEGPEQVEPFLENVLRGRNVPRSRLLEVAEHYRHFGGVSPLNAQNRSLIDALRAELARCGRPLPVYFGNRNWHPFLTETIRQMAADGIRRALAFVTSAYSSYSGCRQYLENIADARQAAGPAAPTVEKLRAFYNHPGFIEPMAENVVRATERLPADVRGGAKIYFTAHSIPIAMADGSAYVDQLLEACRLTAQIAGKRDWQLVYQSRSGSPAQPWLEPDVGDALRQAAAGGVQGAVVAPIGFISDHMEILFDLDEAAAQLAATLGIQMERSATVGTHPKFIAMIRELIEERLNPAAPRRALGERGPSHDTCRSDCCPRCWRSPF